MNRLWARLDGSGNDVSLKCMALPLSDFDLALVFTVLTVLRADGPPQDVLGCTRARCGPCMHVAVHPLINATTIKQGLY